jgi:hypothetical protein
MFCVPARPSFDIDIGIEGPDEISAKTKLEIEEELDNLPTLYKFDLVDFKDLTKKDRIQFLSIFIL